MPDFLEILKTFAVGFLLGGVFAAFKLPIPAPQSFAGVVGIFGVFFGFLVVARFLKF